MTIFSLGYETWAIIKVECSDGKTRLGMNLEDESHEETIVMRGLHYEFAQVAIFWKSNELNLEIFDGECGLYDSINY